MQIRANDIGIEVEASGPVEAPALLLVSGYTSQLTGWPDALIEALLVEGFRVIRYDNRDVGLSQKFDGEPVPDFRAVYKAAHQGGVMPPLAYTLADMAADGIGVLDGLDIRHAHVAGISMGGMIAQLMAIGYPQRLLSMTSIMSGTGNPDLPPATKEAQVALNARPPGHDRATVIAHTTAGRRIWESPAHPKTDAEYEQLIGAAYDRMYYPEGYGRQYAALLADGSRVGRLGQVKTPTLVIHGQEDNLVRVECGVDTARAVPGARLERIGGMGHDLPPPLCPEIAALLGAHMRAAINGA